MKNYFMASLCHNGVLGGAIIVDDETITYRTNKLTVDPKYRNLCINKKDIESIDWKTVIFPVVTFTLKDKSTYKFIIFSPKKFKTLI